MFPVTNNTHTSENILWSAEYYVDYNRTVIGVYDSEEEAYTAYTAKLEELGDDSDFFIKFFWPECDIYKCFYDDLLSFAVCEVAEILCTNCRHNW